MIYIINKLFIRILLISIITIYAILYYIYIAMHYSVDIIYTIININNSVYINMSINHIYKGIYLTFPKIILYIYILDNLWIKTTIYRK